MAINKAQDLPQAIKWCGLRLHPGGGDQQRNDPLVMHVYMRLRIGI